MGSGWDVAWNGRDARFHIPGVVYRPLTVAKSIRNLLKIKEIMSRDTDMDLWPELQVRSLRVAYLEAWYSRKVDLDGL